MSKIHEYVGLFPLMKERIREKWTQLWANSDVSDQGPEGLNQDPSYENKIKQRLRNFTDKTIQRIDRTDNPEDFSHLARTKTRSELMKISAAVMGIEFSYAAETAFVSPLLLNLGLEHKRMTLIWCLSPLMGFFLTPILGSLSDGCRSQLGRRRPFILLLSLGVVLGLILVPNGKWLGRMFGDKFPDDFNQTISIREKRSSPERFANNEMGFMVKTPREMNDFSSEMIEDDEKQLFRKIKVHKKRLNKLIAEINANISKGDDPISINKRLESRGSSASQEIPIQTDESNNEKRKGSEVSSHPWSLVLTVIGTVLLDFDADACQSPSRAYMLDITVPEDHARGLATFTIMAGLGGSLGYVLGAFDWEDTFIGEFFGGHVRAVFTLVLFIYVICVTITIRSFREIPIDRLWPASTQQSQISQKCYARFEDEDEVSSPSSTSSDPCYNAPKKEGDTHDASSQSHVGSGSKAANKSYGSVVEETSLNENEQKSNGRNENTKISNPEGGGAEVMPTFAEYMSTIIHLPGSLAWLCLTNYFCWMSLVCYSLYFTDFVGESVFGGDPSAPKGSESRRLFEAGVRFGCWGMSLYSLSCSIYSFQIEKLVERFGAKRVYVGGQLIYSVGMVLMAIARHKFGVIVFSCCAGVMYSTLFTMPYLLVARYHASETFVAELDEPIVPTEESRTENKVPRGLGTDVAIVSSMVFVAQITQALTLGSLVNYVGSTVVIIAAASVFAFCGALAATKVLYLDL